MTDQEEMGMALLAPLRDEPLGPSSVDLNAAVETAGRHRRRRRLAVIGSAMLALVVMTATAWTLNGRSAVSPPVQVASPSPSGSGYHFDPRHRAFTVEPPDGFRVAGVITGTDSQTVWLAQPPDSTHDGVNAYVVLYAPGVGPTIHSPDVGPRIAAGELWMPNEADRTAPINGRSAYLVKCGNQEIICVQLYWNWSDDGWGYIIVDSYSAEETAAAERRAAAQALAVSLAKQSAPTHEEIVVRTPVSVPAPAGTELYGVLLRGEHRVDLIYLPIAGRPDPAGPSLVVQLRTGLIAESPASDTIDGHPARIEDSEVTIYNVAGDWSLRVTSTPTNLLGGREQLLNFARSVQVVANPDDRTTWLAP